MNALPNLQVILDSVGIELPHYHSSPGNISASVESDAELDADSVPALLGEQLHRLSATVRRTQSSMTAPSKSGGKSTGSSQRSRGRGAADGGGGGGTHNAPPPAPPLDDPLDELDRQLDELVRFCERHRIKLHLAEVGQLRDQIAALRRGRRLNDSHLVAAVADALGRLHPRLELATSAISVAVTLFLVYQSARVGVRIGRLRTVAEHECDLSRLASEAHTLEQHVDRLCERLRAVNMKSGGGGGGGGGGDEERTAQLRRLLAEVDGLLRNEYRRLSDELEVARAKIETVIATVRREHRSRNTDKWVAGLVGVALLVGGAVLGGRSQSSRAQRKGGVASVAVGLVAFGLSGLATYEQWNLEAYERCTVELLDRAEQLRVQLQDQRGRLANLSRALQKG